MYHDSDVHSLIGQSSLRLRMTKNPHIHQNHFTFPHNHRPFDPLHDPGVDQEPKPKAARGSGRRG